MPIFWCATAGAAPIRVPLAPGEMQTSSDGHVYRQPSLASDAFIASIPGYVKQLVGYCERQPWHERIVGYMFFPINEGTTDLTMLNFYDRSEAMQRAWRHYLTEKYGTDAALAAAWGRPGVHLDTVEVPRDDELREKMLQTDQWPNPREMALERDYALLQKALFHRYFTTLSNALLEATRDRPVPLCYDAMKQHLQGWYIHEVFEGWGGVTQSAKAPNMFIGTGSLGVGDLLDLPGCSGLITPADYQARGMGCAFEGEGLSDSLVLRHKLFFIENDARTWLSEEGAPLSVPLGAFLNPREVRAGLLRNSSMTLSRGLQHYWMDIAHGFFNSDAVQAQIRVDRHAAGAAGCSARMWRPNTPSP